jgi:hypothetical protein
MKAAVYILLACSAAWAQPSGGAPVATGPVGASATSPASPDPQLTLVLDQVRSTAQQADADVARLRIEKWKADSGSKQQAQSSADSIRRNLTYAVPDLLQRIQAAPGSLNANFRLYRNLNALFDTFSLLTESAGAFAPRDQYTPLASDLSQLETLRRQMADHMDQLAGANDAELLRLRTQLATTGAAKPPPTRIVVNDDDQPKPKPKKKPKPAPNPPQPPPQ